MTKFAKTYGSALFDLAKEEGLESTILKDVGLISGILQETEGYSKLLQSPALDIAERNKLIDEAWNGSVHAYSLNFLKLVCDKGRISEFSECAAEYKKLYNQAFGIAEAILKCASELPAETLEKLQAALEKRLNKKVVLSVQIDDSLIGGLCLDVDGKRFDGSISNHLYELKKLLGKN